MNNFKVKLPSPCAPANQSLPVVSTTVNVDVSHHAVAALAAEALLAVAFFGRGLITLHCQVVM